MPSTYLKGKPGKAEKRTSRGSRFELSAERDPPTKKLRRKIDFLARSSKPDNGATTRAWAFAKKSAKPRPALRAWQTEKGRRGATSASRGLHPLCERKRCKTLLGLRRWKSAGIGERGHPKRALSVGKEPILVHVGTTTEGGR